MIFNRRHVGNGPTERGPVSSSWGNKGSAMRRLE
jgi:hypothetical protein